MYFEYNFVVFLLILFTHILKTMIIYYFNHFYDRYVTPVTYSGLGSYSVDKQTDSSDFLFTVVRNPWQRLLSTYIQKFIYSNQYLSMCGVKANWAEFDR